LEAQDLPEIPPLPARPTFHISPKDITTYIQPLVSRRWKIGLIYRGRDEDEMLTLNRRYEFKGFRGVMDFVQGHHGRIVLQYNTVDIISHTHSAFTLHHVENGDSKLEKVPGLTRRDIRFAIKIEELYETFKEQGRTPESVPAALGVLQHQSMYSVLRRYGEERTVAKTEDGQSTSTSNAMELQREASLNAAMVAVKNYQGDNDKRKIATEAAPKFARRNHRAKDPLKNSFIQFLGSQLSQERRRLHETSRHKRHPEDH
ncbi:hypothetical protein DEU56DRAFT_737719, partial [Suillus clintonianus]|uniref:uncharacterized protein n=1 Tax=Suillus clintonianus TaxID=1904413 RepID=UPI001B876AD5